MLFNIKRDEDLTDMLHAVTVMGSEDWVVEGTQGLPTQEG